MSRQGELIGEFLRWGALGFVAPIDWGSSKHNRANRAGMWLWAMLFAALALGQLAIGIRHPPKIAEAFTTTSIERPLVNHPYRA
jgi:hypothetical protein